MSDVMSDVVAKLDDLGRPAWVALMVAGFILFWPIGLATLAYLLWSGRMGCGHGAWRNDMSGNWGRWGRRHGGRDEAQRAYGGGNFGPTGNKAFDDYREATLKRLNEEFNEFRSFLDNLRAAKDKAEFEQFMAERRNKPATPPPAQS